MTDTEWLLADSVWWDGSFRPGAVLRVGGGTGNGNAVTLCSAADIPAGAPRRRFPGTLLPALRDAHVHSALVDLATVRAGGIGVVWDLGGVPAEVAALADRAGRQAGPKLPTVRYAGQFLTAPGGYPSDRAWAPAGSWREIRSAADAADAVAENVAAGATLVKVTAHAGGPVLPPPVLAALVAAGHAAGLPVVVHAEGPGTVAAACEAGADLLAHTPWTEPLDAGLVRDCAARMRWISTLDIHGWGQATADRKLADHRRLADLRKLADQRVAVANLRAFLGHGGTVLYGTDLGNGPLPPAVNPREVRALLSAGLSPADVLTAMTENAGVTWVPGGLVLDPFADSIADTIADSIATARVVDEDVRPRRA